MGERSSPIARQALAWPQQIQGSRGGVHPWRVSIIRRPANGHRAVTSTEILSGIRSDGASMNPIKPCPTFAYEYVSGNIRPANWRMGHQARVRGRSPRGAI